ncbi:MAG: hypothetical protein KDD47_12185 [Acidobacteria bacterium]|nr:hypothetical protein [Acidobacteriota bacterium]
MANVFESKKQLAIGNPLSEAPDIHREQERSLKGILGSPAQRPLRPEDWQEVREKAWADSLKGS